MGKDFVGVGEYLFVVEGTIDKSQHWHGESYPWTLGTNPRIEGWIRNIL
jgi:cephalosporin hydroxylase